MILSVLQVTKLYGIERRTMMKQDMIIILDLGSTENTVVARQIRDMGVYSEIHPHDITVEELRALNNVKGIILNGGENRVVDGVAVEVAEELYSCGLPMISIDHPTSKCDKKYVKMSYVVKISVRLLKC